MRVRRPREFKKSDVSRSSDRPVKASPMSFKRDLGKLGLGLPESKSEMSGSDQDSPPDSPLEDGECGPLAETSIDVSGGLETHGHMCLLPFNAVSGMAYAIKFRKGESFGGSSAVVRATAVLCGEIQYKIDQGGINEITMGEDSYEVDYPDPLKDFNTRVLAILDISSVKASCMKVFHAFQREILGNSHVKDVLDKEQCISLESHTCGLYRNTVGRRAATPPLVE
ncbi:hypothetical protein FOZ61_000604 [Perkinsus olseni]|nr:hypothetical protein FOZ61_000604 [Perkinsus olseni]